MAAPVPAPTMPPELMTTRDVAARLSVSRARVYALMRAGELRSTLIGASRRVWADSVDEYIGRLRAEGGTFR